MVSKGVHGLAGSVTGVEGIGSGMSSEVTLGR